jgi:hypothetical protein
LAFVLDLRRNLEISAAAKPGSVTSNAGRRQETALGFS